MSTNLRLLILEDNSYDAELEIATLEEAGYVCRWERVESQTEFLARLASRPPDYDLILADYNLPAFDGLTALKLFLELDLNLPFILVSGALGEEIAIESLKAGATDYVLKTRLERLGPVVERALREKEEQQQRKRAEKLLRSLNRAALAIEKALTPDEIFVTVSEEFRKLGFLCTVFLTDKSQARLFVKYQSYTSKVIKAVEKLAGLKTEDFSMPIDAVEAYRKVVRERQTVLVEDTEEVMRQLLPERASSLAGKITKLMKMRQLIITPLIVKDKVIGVLSVQAEDLSRDDKSTITAFGNQVAAAWRKAYLYEQAQQEIAERKRAEQALRESEEQLRHAQKMEAIGTLAGGVAHDFNNLLTVINGYAELVLMHVEKDHPLYKDVNSILAAGRRASNLTNQLLAFSRKQIYKPRIVDINQVITGLEKMLRRLVSEDINMETNLRLDLPLIEADPGQLEQILINLVVNARDAINERTGLAAEKKITIETGQTYLDETLITEHIGGNPGLHIFFAVSDNGIGMREEIKSKIFDPFFTTKEKGRGTGLGMATVYGIVKQNQGNINVYSEPGQGTTFKIYWPVTEDQIVQKVQVKPGRDVLTGSEAILLVEDDEAVRNFAGAVLKGFGYTVFKASNGKSALELIKENDLQIDLLITDLVMPEMNGEELAAKLQEIFPATLVLYASGYTDNHVVHSGILEKGVNFIHKPYSVQTLAEKVREVLENGNR
jgi:signal transduction histidine kinase/DNA-binding response OmpR family regulator